MSSVFAVSPAFGDGRIEEFSEHAIRIYWYISHFEQTRTLEFSETLQFAAGKTSQKIESQVQI